MLVGSGHSAVRHRKVTNSATGYSAELAVKVNKAVNIHNVLASYVMPEKYLSTIERVSRHQPPVPGPARHDPLTIEWQRRGSLGPSR